MKRRTYRAAVDEVLIPCGFQRKNHRDWVRREGGFYDLVSIQVSALAGGTTFGIFFNDEDMWSLLRQAVPDITGPIVMSERLWRLTGDLYDKWWRKGDPNGPSEVAWALREYGLPLLQKLRSIEFQMTRFGPLVTDRPRDVWGQIWLAMSLYRLGRHEEARRVINEPTRRMSEQCKFELEGVRRWIMAKTGDGA